MTVTKNVWCAEKSDTLWIYLWNNKPQRSLKMKRFFSLMLLVVLIGAGTLFAQADANSHNNWISGEVSILGVGARYERMLNDNWSVGGNIYFNVGLVSDQNVEVGLSGRFYPWGKIFFVGLGLGYHHLTKIIDNAFWTIDYGPGGIRSEYIWASGTLRGFSISPEIGWKIDVGNVGGFFLQPGVKLPITLGSVDELTKGGRMGSAYSNETILNIDYDKFQVGFDVVIYLGMGYAF